jgi:hypothetical protein
MSDEYFSRRSSTPSFLNVIDWKPVHLLAKRLILIHQLQHMSHHEMVGLINHS